MSKWIFFFFFTSGYAVPAWRKKKTKPKPKMTQEKKKDLIAREVKHKPKDNKVRM